MYTYNIGKHYKQLLKSGDDTRQDAVMEQVFDLVNYIFQHTIRTRERNLHIRIYKILPITPLIGLIEWVDNTVSMVYVACVYILHIYVYVSMYNSSVCIKDMS